MARAESAKESHALGSKVENIDINDKTTKRKIKYTLSVPPAGGSVS